jgi:hypothetical protein
MGKVLGVLSVTFVLAACGGSSATPSQSNAGSPAASAGGGTNGGGGGSQLTVSGAITGTIGSPHCTNTSFEGSSIPTITATGTSSGGTAMTLVVTNESGGKALLDVGKTAFVWDHKGGTFSDTTGTTATFSAATLSPVTGATVIVNGTLTC